MKSTEELKELYELELKPQLEGMEKKRKVIKRLYRLGTTSAILLFIFLPSIDNQIIAIVIGILGIIGTIIIFIRATSKYFTYRKEFKQQVVVKIINLINPDFKYNADRHIEVVDFNNSSLFSKKADRSRGDDFISGKIEKTEFKFSELQTDYKITTKKDGRTETSWHTIFTGLFFHADFNKHIQGTTYVLPDTAEKLLGKIGQKLQTLSSRGELVKLENPEFEKEFVVYSTSQQEARYILTPVMMEAFVNIAKKYKRKLYFSFKGSRIYCAVKFKKGLFEPQIKRSGVNFNEVEEMYNLFGLIELIIHEMNLNTRIWTKV